MLYLTGFQGFTWNPTGGIPSRCWEAPAVVGRCRARWARWSYTVSDQKWFPVDFKSAWLCTNTLHSLHDPNVFFHPLLLKISKHIKRVLSTQTGPCQGLNMIKTDWRNCIKKLSLAPHNYFKKVLEVHDGFTLTCDSRFPLPINGRQSLHLGKTPCVWGKKLGAAMSGLALHKCVVVFFVDQDHASLISFCLRWCWQTFSLPDIIRGCHLTEWNYPTENWLQLGLRSPGPFFLHPHQGPCIPCCCCCWPPPCQGNLVGPH